MNIQTSYLGEVAIEQDMIIHFPKGLPGFPEETSFILLDIPGNPLFQMLQSTQTSSLAFIVTNPHQFYMDYSFELDAYTMQQMEIKIKEDIIVFVIVTLKKPFTDSTINLKAPLLINRSKKIGKQYVLQEAGFSVRAPIHSAEKKEV